MHLMLEVLPFIVMTIASSVPFIASPTYELAVAVNIMCVGLVSGYMLREMIRDAFDGEEDLMDYYMMRGDT